MNIIYGFLFVLLHCEATAACAAATPAFIAPRD